MMIREKRIIRREKIKEKNGVIENIMGNEEEKCWRTLRFASEERKKGI